MTDGFWPAPPPFRQKTEHCDHAPGKHCPIGSPWHAGTAQTFTQARSRRGTTADETKVLLMSRSDHQMPEAGHDLLADRRSAKKAERKDADRIMRLFANSMLARGFKRKSTFFARRTGPIIRFLHVHKYRFGGAFRIHVCVRAVNSPRPFVALFGIENRESRPTQKFDYTTGDAASIKKFAAMMSAFIEDVAEPWLKAWSPLFLQSKRSFPPEEDRHHLEEDLRGLANASALAPSLSPLGLAQPPAPARPLR